MPSRAAWPFRSTRGHAPPKTSTSSLHRQTWSGSSPLWGRWDTALRALCVRLPHLATEDERRELELFTTLATDPRSVTENDVRALVAGWSAWWRQGPVDRICGMADQIPADLHMSMRELATLSTAAHLARWQRTQRHVWTCTVCVGQARVATDLRQQTPAPRRD